MMLLDKAHWPTTLGDEFHDLQDLVLNLDVQTHTLQGSWGNLGYWLTADGQPITHYSDAAQQLAHKLGEFAQLHSGDCILDVGFGCGDQVVYWHQQFLVAHVWGINLSVVQTHYAQQKLSSGPFYHAVSLQQGNACDAKSWIRLPEHLDHILALDCIYHFSNKRAFFQLCQTRLLAWSNTSTKMHTLVVSDLVLTAPLSNPLHILFLKVLCRLSHIPFENLKTQAAYEQELSQVGLRLLAYDNISAAVMLPFSAWVKDYREQVRNAKRSGEYSPRLQTIKWWKYMGTAFFLRWASRHKIFQYALLRIGVSSST